MSENSKGSKPKSKKKRKDPRVENEYFEEVELTDPETGEKFTQKVKITRYKSSGMPKLEGKKGLPDEEIGLDEEENFSSWNEDV